MAKKEKNKEELTTKMHSEFGVDKDTDQKHATWTALESIADGDMTKQEAMEEYGVTEEDFKKYTPEYDELSDD